MKKKIFYFSILIFIFTILCLSPICGDDWGNYIISSKGIYHAFSEAVGMYFDWEGRFVSRVIINLLTSHKILWNIVNSIFIVGIIYYFVKIINPKHKNIIYLLSLGTILFMNVFTFSQVVSWIAGNITYLFIVTLLLLYYYIIFSNKKSNKCMFYFLVLLNFTMTMFVEHMAIILVFSNILFIIYKYKKEKVIDKELVVYLISAIIGTLLMLLSPGSMKRVDIDNVAFSKLSLFDKIKTNIPNFVFYTFICNSYLLVLMVISNYYLIKKYIKNKFVRVLSIILCFISILTTANYLLFNLKITNYNIFSNQNNIIIIIYYILYTIFTFYLLIKEKNIKAIFFYIIGILSNLVMIMSPVWGYRTSFSTYIFLVLSSLIIINKYIKENNIINYILYFITILISLFYLILYISIHKLYVDNLNVIKQGIKNKKKVIEIVRYPHYVNCNINPENDFHMMRFKKYYKISSNVEVKLTDNNFKYLIFYNK